MLGQLIRLMEGFSFKKKTNKNILSIERTTRVQVKVLLISSVLATTPAGFVIGKNYMKLVLTFNKGSYNGNSFRRTNKNEIIS